MTKAMGAVYVTCIQMNAVKAHTHTPTCTACLSYRDMEFMGEGRELVPDAALPLVEAPCWFWSPSVSMAAEDAEETSVSQTHGKQQSIFALM